VWSDPDPDAPDWGDNERGTSVCFGQPQVESFLNDFGFDLVCRSNEAVMEGFDFPFRPDQSLVTLFSTPNYGYEFDNKGAILHVDGRLYCSFTQLDPRTYPLPNAEPAVGSDERPGTPPRQSGGSEQATAVCLIPRREDGGSDDSQSSEEESNSETGDDDKPKVEEDPPADQVDTGVPEDRATEPGEGSSEPKDPEDENHQT
jgi:hypothetical protein